LRRRHQDDGLRRASVGNDRSTRRPFATDASSPSPLERALELAERGRGTTRPNPVVGAVVVRDGETVGEGWHERAGGPHAEIVALAAAGERARGATLYVTLEPCSHHGRTPPCTDAILAAGVAKVIVGSRDPTPRRSGIDLLRAAGIEVEEVGGETAFRLRQQNEAWRTWVQAARPFVTYKAAVTLDGRMTLPRTRWISGPASRRLVHELRAASDAVAVGMGTFRADAPQLTARDVGATRQPRRLVFGRGPLPVGSELELRSGPLEEELRLLAGEGVQSLLLEGGPTLASAFLRAALVDKLLVFVAPTLGGSGPSLAEAIANPVALRRLSAREVGEDLLLTAYVHEP
jgi:diaminohydroxyphosphoribosylaminopyrimidine deaminase / 5-amino-6-(5-phosphoribosylamino)uracil reductase